jgi:flagellar hook-associated protein 1 FlgK
MSDLLSILNAGAASLAAQQAAAATASHNLANANTPGYARQRVELEAVLPAERVSGGFIGRGVRLTTVSQARDRFLEAQIPRQLGLASFASARSSALDAVSALDPQTAGNLGAALSAFYTSLRQLSQNAGDAGLRQAAVGAARALAFAFNTTAGSLEQSRSGIDQRLAGAVSEVNDLTGQVALYNRDIRAARAAGGEPNDLLDARQKAVDRLAELTGATPVPTSEGDLSLFMPGGTALVSGITAGTLSTLPDAANGGHLSLRFAQPGLAPQAVASAGGELGGLVDARDGALRSAVTGLDTLAFDLGSALNAVHAAGVGLDGSTGLTLFDVGATSAGAAARLSVSAAVATDPSRLAAAGAAAALPGDATNLAALVGTETQALSGGLDATSTFARITSEFGTASRSADAAAELEGSLRDHLETMREATSGVSVDEELIALQKAQRGYEAITRVIQVTSDLFDTLLQLK